jgi:hypothetical protein
VAAQVVPRMTVGAFLADPGQLLAEYPNGGAQIRDLAVANPVVLLPILSLLSNANKYQKFAIGNGLAQAAKLVLRTNQPYASDIQDAVARTKDQEVVLAYEGNTSARSAPGRAAAELWAARRTPWARAGVGRQAVRRPARTQPATRATLRQRAGALAVDWLDYRKRPKPSVQPITARPRARLPQRYRHRSAVVWLICDLMRIGDAASLPTPRTSIMKYVRT